MEFSSSDIKDMRTFYEHELSSTLERLRHIESVLAKIGGSKINVAINVGNTPTISATTATKAAKKTTIKKRGAKRGPKSIWGNFVMKKLKELDKPLTYDELIAEAMRFANVPAENENKIRQSIINVTFRLRTQEKKIDTFSKGSRIKYLALKTWFGSDGAIDPAYAKKASNVKPKPTQRKKAAPKRPKAAVKKAATVKKAAPVKKAVAKKAPSVVKKAAPVKKVAAPKSTLIKKTSGKSTATAVKSALPKKASKAASTSLSKKQKANEPSSVKTVPSVKAESPKK